MYKRLLIGILITGIFLFILVSIEPVLHYHAQQPPFQNTLSYFTDHLSHPGGITEYLADFMMLGFINTFSGSIIILISSLLLSFFLSLILNNLQLPNNMLFTLLPALFLIIVIQDYYFPFELLIQSVFIYLFLYVITIVKRGIPFLLVSSLLFYILVYYLAGSGAGLVFAISSVAVISFMKGLKKRIIPVFSLILAAGVLPWIMQVFIFNLSLKQSYFHFFPEVPVTLIYNKNYTYQILVFHLPVLIALLAIFASLRKKGCPLLLKPLSLLPEVSVWLKESILFVLTLGVGIYLLSLNYNKHKKNIVLADFHSFNRNWDQVIRIALEDKEYDFGINLNYNRAIDNNGQFLEKFFEYPQLLGINSLYPDNLRSPVFSMPASDYYLDLSYVTRSQHWAYAALTIEPLNPRILKRLVVTNLILGNKGAAKTYLNVLSLNPVCQEFVNEYQPYLEDNFEESTNAYIVQKRKFMPGNFAIPVNIKDRLRDLIEKDSTNRQAFEHLQLCYLLDHELGDFTNNLLKSSVFYNQMPTVYEQGFIVFLYTTGETRSKIPISDLTKNQFQHFLSTQAKFKSREEAMPYLKELKNTYFYYVTYLSPKVTKVEVQVKKQESQHNS